MPLKLKWQFWKALSSPVSPEEGQNPKTTKIESPQKITKSKNGITKLTILGHSLLVVWAFSGAIAVSFNFGIVQWFERQTQTFFLRKRGQVAHPQDIIILAIDENSMSQGDQFLADPDQFPDFAPLERWPWKREAYAQAIAKILESGAKAIAIDLVFDRPSIYGKEDDQKLRQVLEKYPGKITLAAVYDDSEIRQGGLLQLIQPNEIFRVNNLSVGSINYPLEKNGKIHRLGNYFPKYYSDSLDDPELAKVFHENIATIPSFAEATLQAAQINFLQPQGEDIFYYGPAHTFEYISFADILDPNNWQGYLKNGAYFKDKIVLIGPTAELHQDFHPTPVATKMTGIEINANAIATLKQGTAIRQAFPHPFVRGIAALITITIIGIFIGSKKRWLTRLSLSFVSAISWLAACYFILIYANLILPSSIPTISIILIGISYGVIGATKDLFGKLQLKKTLKYYSSSPLVRKILTQQEDEDFKDVLQEREEELFAQKLANRYQIIEQLSSGGFGETFIAEDTLRPGNPRCVVKQLRPLSDKPKVWELARRLFLKEAEILEKLGKHDQIPQLLAYFEEEEEFYLVQELVIGRTFSHEIPIAVPFSEPKVIAFLKDLLPVLGFIHDHGVIHRDLKPDNLIRRKLDRKLIIIDFGTVKEIATVSDDDETQPEKTVAIGTRGYMPLEQLAGTPQFNSDIYALGMIAIETMTLSDPYDLEKDPETGEIIWEELVEASPELIAILRKMVKVNYRERYQNTEEVLADLEPLIANLPDNFTLEKEHQQQLFMGASNPDDSTNADFDSTTPWHNNTNNNDHATVPWPEGSKPGKKPDNNATFNWSGMVNSLSTELRSEFEEENQPDDDDPTNPWP
jgi:serine/threonine protein kinase/CHASE2 domain-containing sensor protein